MVGVGQLDNELVHGPAVLAADDLDGDDVAPDGADPAGHGAEGPGPVRELDPDEEGGHDQGYVQAVNDVFGPRSTGLRERPSWPAVYGRGRCGSVRRDGGTARAGPARIEPPGDGRLRTGIGDGRRVVEPGARRRREGRSMGDLVERLVQVVGRDNVRTGTRSIRTTAMTRPSRPGRCSLGPRHPGCAPSEVVGVLQVADKTGTPVTARGSGTGLSGGSVPRVDGILVSFERMNAILEIDTENHVAVVQPGVTLEELDRVTAGTASCTRCSPARAVRRSGATWPPTPGGCGPSNTG